MSINFVFLAGITYFFKDNISLFLTKEREHGILILAALAAHFFSGTAISFYFTYFKNAERAMEFTKYRILITVSNFILSILFVAYLKIGIIGILIAQILTGIFLFFYLLLLFLKELRFSLNKNLLSESLKIGYPLTPRIFIGVFNTQFDKYMVGLLATMNGVGVYHIGKKISELIFAFMTAIENIFNPQVYNRMFRQHEEGFESIGKYLTPFIYVSTFMALCIGIFSEEVISLLAPAPYHGAIPICTILSMYFGYMFFGKIVGIQLVYAKKTHITSLLSLLGVGLNISLNIILIMKFGAAGAALATALAGFISGTIGIIVAQRYMRVKYEWGKIYWIMGVLFFGVIAILIIYLLKLPYLWSLLIKGLIITIFINLGVRYGIVSQENFRAVKSVLYSQKILKY